VFNSKFSSITFSQNSIHGTQSKLSSYAARTLEAPFDLLAESAHCGLVAVVSQPRSVGIFSTLQRFSSRLTVRRLRAIQIPRPTAELGWIGYGTGILDGRRNAFPSQQ